MVTQASLVHSLHKNLTQWYAEAFEPRLLDLDWSNAVTASQKLRM